MAHSRKAQPGAAQIKRSTAPRFQRPAIDQPVAWLGGLTPAQFMRRYWQKKPLLVRHAFSDLSAAIGIQEVLDLATHEWAESRRVKHSPRSGRWTLDHGPFDHDDLPSLATSNWTVLVQNVNTLLPKADEFLNAFRFVPEARLDDLMISVAGPGGGVGPHVDSYDVFLVQAEGLRHWEIAMTNDLEFEPDLPLKILKRFSPTEDWVLAPGDLLYLPPKVAHRGTAVGSRCMTWSVGFRAPSAASLADAAFGRHLETLPDRPWSDPWLTASNAPGQIPQPLLASLTRQVMAKMPPASSVRLSVAATLSEPPPGAIFTAPDEPHSERQFLRQIRTKGLKLHPASRMLFTGSIFFANGEMLPKAEHRDARGAAMAVRALKALANDRRLAGGDCQCLAEATWLGKFIYQMYLDGWIVYDSESV